MSRTAPGAVIVGTGFGVLTHLRAMRAAGFDVRALVGRDAEKARERARLFDVPNALTSLDEALALPGVEAVAVATPPHSHCEIVLAALAAGKHVLCEKPFARDAAEGERMLAAAERAGVVHLLGTEFRFATGQALAARAVAGGAIGTPRLATFVLQMPALTDPAAELPDWWTRSSEGGGWLGAFGSHVIDQLQGLLGSFVEVSASLGALAHPDWTADDSYTIHFRTDRGAEGVLQSSCAARGPLLSTARVVGDRGTLWIAGDDVFVADAEGERKLDVPEDLVLPAPVPPPGELLVTAYDMLHSMGIDLAPYTRLYEGMLARMRGGASESGPVPATFAEGVSVQRVLDAARRSSTEGGAVTIKPV